jgi:hypothetical protein
VLLGQPFFFLFGNYFLKGLGAFFILLVVIELSKRDGYVKGFSQGFDEGITSVDDDE